MAIGTILAARDFGLRVPEDLSVIGMDGHELCDVFGLTTIDQDARGQGALAARLLLDTFEARIPGQRGSGHRATPPGATDREYPTELVIRTSTAIPPA
jgi:DNA-binding LacI/PurR family transcriptional regulator